jgi:hypothetical protein
MRRYFLSGHITLAHEAGLDATRGQQCVLSNVIIDAMSHTHAYLLLYLSLQLNHVRPLRVIQRQLLLQLLQNRFLFLLTHFESTRVGNLQTV